MRMSYYNISNAVDDLTAIFIKSGYSKNTITENRRNIQKVVDAHLDYGQQFYDEKVVEKYISTIKEKYDAHLMSRTRKNALLKAASYVKQISTTGNILIGVREFPDKLSPYYRNILEKIKLSNDWSEGLKQNIVYAAHTYFLFLLDMNIQDIKVITEDTIRFYIMQKVSHIEFNSMDTIRRNLKHLHLWLYENEYIEDNFSEILSFTTPRIHKIKKPVPQDEIALMLQNINRETAIGKRNYAMFMLAVVTGMRSVDIVELKLHDIDWINGEIKLTQKKTDVMLALPLTTDVGEALKDYILYGRPQTDFKNVFLTSRIPIQPLGRRAVYGAFNCARSSVGLKKVSFHGLRRAVGTNMVIAGVPVTTVAQVLGHSEISSTNQYISLDSVHLKECALGLYGISQKGHIYE